MQQVALVLLQEVQSLRAQPRRAAAAALLGRPCCERPWPPAGAVGVRLLLQRHCLQEAVGRRLVCWTAAAAHGQQLQHQHCCGAGPCWGTT